MPHFRRPGVVTTYIWEVLVVSTHTLMVSYHLWSWEMNNNLVDALTLVHDLPYHCHSLWDTTSWSLLGPGVEVGLTPNCMKGIHIFPLLIVGSFFFYFLPSKLDVQCMVITKKEQNIILFKTLLNWCSKNIINNANWVKGISIHIFIKNQNSIRCNDFKSKVCFNIVIGFENWNIKIQLMLIGIWIAYYWFYLIRCGYISC
jgi:hypothetical protein